MKKTARSLFVENLKYYRKQKGLTQLQLDIQINKSANYINGVENCGTFPSPEVIDDIADALDVSVQQLFAEGIFPQNAVAENDRFVAATTERICKKLSTQIKSTVRKELLSMIRTH